MFTVITVVLTMFSRPFSVTPASGTLDVGESMQVTVDFHPTTVGDHRQDLLLHYHTGKINVGQP